jgi:hypothetical protein
MPIYFGELNETGGIVRDVRVCAITGVVTQPGDALVPIPNSRAFVRISANAYANLPLGALERVFEQYHDQTRKDGE